MRTLTQVRRFDTDSALDAQILRFLMDSVRYAHYLCVRSLCFPYCFAHSISGGDMDDDDSSDPPSNKRKRSTGKSKISTPPKRAKAEKKPPAKKKSPAVKKTVAKVRT